MDWLERILYPVNFFTLLSCYCNEIKTTGIVCPLGSNLQKMLCRLDYTELLFPCYAFSCRAEASIVA